MDIPTIPVIIPALATLLPVFRMPFTPNTIPKIPVGNDKYQNKAVTIEIIPSVSAAALNGDLFFSIIFPPNYLILIP